jgi:hypothetical protein
MLAEVYTFISATLAILMFLVEILSVIMFHYEGITEDRNRV